MDDSIQAFLAASPPRLPSPADLDGLPEFFPPTNLPPAAAAWLAPYSPLVPASSAASYSARVIPAGAMEGMTSAVALDQVVRPVGTPAGAPASADCVGRLGPPLAITSSMHVPVAVDGPFVLGLSISDVVLDAVRLIDDVHPVMRCVYDSMRNVVMMMGVYGDGSTVSASTVHVGEDDGALTVLGSILKRPTLPGGRATLLLRSSSRDMGDVQQASRVLHDSPKDAYLSFVHRMVGQFGCAAVSQMVGGDDAAAIRAPSPPPPPPLMTSTIFTELSSQSVVARLAAIVLEQGAVHPLGLRVGPAIGVGRRPAVLAPSGRRGPLSVVEEGAGLAAGTQLAVHGRAASSARSSGVRTRTKVCLDQVVDEAERARIVRNRESAARSNAKRQAERLAAARVT